MEKSQTKVWSDAFPPSSQVDTHSDSHSYLVDYEIQKENIKYKGIDLKYLDEI